MALVTGVVQNPALAQYADQAQPFVTVDRHGALLVAERGGKYAAAAMRGNVFYASSLIAGVALPVNAINCVTKATLHNPSSSTKWLELIEFTLGIDSATEVVNGLALAFQTGVAAQGAPTTLTVAPNTGSTLLGAGLTKQAIPYTAATLVNAAVLPVYPLGLNWDATAVGRSGNFVYNFDGKIIVPPDTLVTFCTTVAAATAAPWGLTWAEWLP